MSASATHHHEEEVHLAIYDLSMGMARSLSGQFLGPQHAVDIIPHTAIIAFGKEYFFGRGIEWCSPIEFRATRGIQPIELRPLGRTSCTESQFEAWCRARAADGSFGTESYDFFHRNCNNFSEEAARRGLRLGRGVPDWILDMPRKFLSSPMGMALRPMLEGMQIANNAPTNLPAGGSSFGRAATSSPAAAFAPAATTPAAAAAATNPWANIPAPTASTPSQQTQPSATADTTPMSGNSVKTPLLDKQTALLSTDTGMVKVCIDRLKPEPERVELLSKLADAEASWKPEEIDSIHRYLRSVIELNNSRQHLSFALMLLRLAVLRRSAGGEELSQSTQLVAGLILEDGGATSPAARSMAWCVLSNAAGSSQPPDHCWDSSAAGADVRHGLGQIIDGALGDCDPCEDGSGSSPPGNVSLRQSAAAFLYNSARYLTADVGGMGDGEDGGTDLSEDAMSILLGCLEHLQNETDVIAMQRLYMAVGQLLKSRKFGETAASLVNDLGLVDDEIGGGKGMEEVRSLAREVSALLG